jgi:hypothetical protein
LEKPLFRKLTGKNLDDLRLPALDDVNRKLEAELLTRHPLRDLGHTQAGQTFLTEEDRESHIHILGSPGEGKSKFLEHLIRQDIQRGYGACLLDPSDNGDTAYKILRHCAKIGFEKVCLIDPHHRYKNVLDVPEVVPVINPLHEGAPSSAVIGDMMDTIRTLWGTKDFAETARIQKYLPAVFYTLHKARMTLHESLYFTDHSNPTYTRRRMEMLDALHPLDRHRVTLEEVFRTRTFYSNEFSSSIRRIEPFLEDTMKLIFGGKTGINFGKMVTEGWLILCNLDPQGIFGQEHQRLIGTSIINEITYAIHRLREHAWKGVYYLYIDEVGDYATPKLAYLLDKKRKSGLRVTLAHQGFDQIGDSQVLSSVYRSTKTKVLFNTKDPSDQKKMIAMMYGGELNSEQTRYALMQLRKQHAIIKVDKGDPAVTRIPDIPDITIDQKVLSDFISKLYRQPWYHHPKTVLEEINARFKETKPGRPSDASSVRRQDEEERRDTEIPVTRTANDSQPARRAHAPTRPKGNVEAFFSEAEFSGLASQTPDPSGSSQPRKRKSRSPK